VVVFDCQALARAVTGDEYLRGVIRLAKQENSPVVVSVATMVEVIHPRIDTRELRYVLSLIRLVDVTADIARSASELLSAAGLHGHTHALDSFVCATALASQGHPTIYTSDLGDVQRLVGNRASVIRV
jgi:predicted nucleic acid-binding protein